MPDDGGDDWTDGSRPRHREPVPSPRRPHHEALPPMLPSFFRGGGLPTLPPPPASSSTDLLRLPGPSRRLSDPDGGMRMAPYTPVAIEARSRSPVSAPVSRQLAPLDSVGIVRRSDGPFRPWHPRPMDGDTSSPQRQPQVDGEPQTQPDGTGDQQLVDDDGDRESSSSVQDVRANARTEPSGPTDFERRSSSSGITAGGEVESEDTAQADGPVCSNCATRTTPLWRRDGKGGLLCNACGLFAKVKGRPRPHSLKTDVIKPRARKTRRPNRSHATIHGYPDLGDHQHLGWSDGSIGPGSSSDSRHYPAPGADASQGRDYGYDTEPIPSHFRPQVPMLGRRIPEGYDYTAFDSMHSQRLPSSKYSPPMSDQHQHHRHHAQHPLPHPRPRLPSPLKTLRSFYPDVPSSSMPDFRYMYRSRDEDHYARDHPPDIADHRRLAPLRSKEEQKLDGSSSPHHGRPARTHLNEHRFNPLRSPSPEQDGRASQYSHDSRHHDHRDHRWQGGPSYPNGHFGQDGSSYQDGHREQDRSSYRAGRRRGHDQPRYQDGFRERDHLSEQDGHHRRDHPSYQDSYHESKQYLRPSFDSDRKLAPLHFARSHVEDGYHLHDGVQSRNQASDSPEKFGRQTDGFGKHPR